MPAGITESTHSVCVSLSLTPQNIETMGVKNQGEESTVWAHSSEAEEYTDVFKVRIYLGPRGFHMSSPSLPPSQKDEPIARRDRGGAVLLILDCSQSLGCCLAREEQEEQQRKQGSGKHL